MSARKCPVCGKPTEQQHRPFCSRRCADVDLQRWLSDGYAIPATTYEAVGEEGPLLIEDDED